MGLEPVAFQERRDALFYIFGGELFLVDATVYLGEKTQDQQGRKQNSAETQ